MSVTELFEEAAFEADVTVAMGKAFELACRSFRGGEHPDLIEEIIAKRIVIFARRGVADPSLLCREALNSLGLDYDCE